MQSSQLASAAYAVTPNDGTDLPSTAFGLYIGTGGTLKVDCGNDPGTQSERVTVSFAAVAAGFLPLKVIRVYATGTAATGIVAFEE